MHTRSYDVLDSSDPHVKHMYGITLSSVTKNDLSHGSVYAYMYYEKIIPVTYKVFDRIEKQDNECIGILLQK